MSRVIPEQKKRSSPLVGKMILFASPLRTMDEDSTSKVTAAVHHLDYWACRNEPD
jgi:hypothetical protein